MKVALIGAGNVSYHLSLQFAKAGVEITQVFSRRKKRAETVASICGADAIDSLSETLDTAEIYIIAVHDHAISEVASEIAKIGIGQKLMVHTSGATPSTVFEKTGAKRYGVFYPLQTLSQGSTPDFSQIPLCIDAVRQKDLKLLEKLGSKICHKVYHVPDDQRAVLHVAAVIVNNFSNHLFHIGKNILDQNHLPFDLILPLIKETVAKLDRGTPGEMQTGPALRGDKNTIERHLALLSAWPDYQKIYTMLSESIVSGNKKN